MPPSRPDSASKLLDVLLWIWAACVALFLASQALTQWPGLNHDAALYSTPIIRSAALGKWEFDSFVLGFIFYDSPSFDMHGQLYQFLFAKIFRAASYPSLIAWSAALNVVTYVAYLGATYRACRVRQPGLAAWLANGVASCAALACVYLQGRPEHPLPLLMLVPFLLREWPRTRPLATMAAYAVLGLVVVLSPVPGLICLLGVLAWIGLRYPGRRFVIEGFRCAGVSLASAILVLLIAAPVNPLRWVQNVRSAGAAAGFVGSKASIGHDTFLSAAIFDLPFWNVFTLVAIALLAVGLWRRKRWWLILPLALVFALVLGPMQIYSWFGFLPVIMLALIHDDVRLLSLPRALRRAPEALDAAFGFFTMAALARIVVLGVLHAASGTSFAQTSTEIRTLEARLGAGERIGYMWTARPSFVAFSDPARFLLSVNPEVIGGTDAALHRYERQFGQRVTWLLLPQLNQLRTAPPTLDAGRFVLEHDGWTSRRARVLGVKIGGAWPGYQYALYRRVNVPATAVIAAVAESPLQAARP